MESSEQSLSHIFVQSRANYDRLGDLDPRSQMFKDSLQESIEGLQKSRDLIARLALFSPNESMEEISTRSLPFLTVNYLLADLLLKSYDSNRRETLKRASHLLDDFLTTLDQYEFLSSADRKLYEQFQENPTSFSLMSTANFEERRKIKIARFQQEKALKQKLDYLQGQAKGNNVDDEILRSLSLAEISYFVNQTFQSLDMITQENSILAQSQSTPIPNLDPSSPNDARAPTRKESYSERLDGPISGAGLGRNGGPILNSSGKPLQPFTLLDKRTQLRQGVFRPSHNLPTMTIDEYLEEEKKRGGIIDGGGNANSAQPEPDEDNMALVDAATMKAREWDEFVEANPKGAGNTLNRG